MFIHFCMQEESTCNVSGAMGTAVSASLSLWQVLILWMAVQAHLDLGYLQSEASVSS